MATSGTFTGSRGGGTTNGPYLTLSWSRIATDIPNNKSQIRLTLNLEVDYSINFSASKTGVLQGTSFTYTGGYSGTATKTLKTSDIWVTHNSDGSLTTTFSASFNIGIVYGGVTINSMSVSGSATIDSIPRASGFTAFTLSNSVLNKDTAVTVNYTLDRKSASFSQDMVLKIGNTTIKSWNTTGTGALTQALSTAEVNSIISNVPNATSGTLTLEMQTKSGTTKVGSAVSRTATFTLNTAIAPTATALTVAIAGTGRDKTINQYVQGISKVTANFTRTAGHGATISTNTIVVKRQSDGGNSQTIASNSGTTANPVSLSGVYSVTATVTDSRGRTATVSTTITVVAYSAPTITTFTAARDATTSTTVKATINVYWAVIGTNNPTNITVVGKDNAGVTQTLYTLSDNTSGTLNATQNYTGQGDISSYTYTITITDSFGKVATAVSKIGTTFVELTIAKGLGIGVGKVHQNGALDVRGATNLEGPVTLMPTPAGTKVASVFTGITAKSYINFTAVAGNNDPGYIMHETSSTTADINKGVIHICPSDDNDNVADYVAIHGTNDPETIKLFTGGNIETTGAIKASNYQDSGWVNLTLTSAFTSYTSNALYIPKVRKVGSIVELQGEISPASATNDFGSDTTVTITTIPDGYRPSQRQRIVCHGSGLCIWLLGIDTSGIVTISRYRDENGARRTNLSTSTWLPFSATFIV